MMARYFAFLLTFAVLISACGSRARVQVPVIQPPPVVLGPTPTPIPPPICPTPFTAVLMPVPTGEAIVGVPLNFSIQISGGCAGSLYKIQNRDLPAFTSTASFSITFNSVGDQVVSESVTRVDSQGNLFETKLAGPITISVVLPPTPTPPPGPTPPPLSCQFVRTSSYSPSLPNLSFELRLTGVLNGATVSAVQDALYPVPPLPNTLIYVAPMPPNSAGQVNLHATVQNPTGNPVECGVQVIVPSCVMTASNIKYDSADVAVTLSGPIAVLKIDGEPISPLPATNVFTKTITYTSNGTERTSSALVQGIGPYYDYNICGVKFTPPTLRSVRIVETPPNSPPLLSGTAFYDRTDADYRYVFAVDTNGVAFYSSVHLDNPDVGWRLWAQIDYQWTADWVITSGISWIDNYAGISTNDGITVYSRPKAGDAGITYRYGMNTSFSGGVATFTPCISGVYNSWCYLP